VLELDAEETPGRPGTVSHEQQQVYCNPGMKFCGQSCIRDTDVCCAESGLFCAAGDACVSTGSSFRCASGAPANGGQGPNVVGGSRSSGFDVNQWLRDRGWW
jgi:hypothetical protein